MKIVKKLLPVTLALCLLLFSVLAASEVYKINLSDIQKKEGFSFSKSDKSLWTYYSSAETAGTKGEKVKLLLASWGKNAALRTLPELRFFVCDANGKDLIAQGASMLIGSNMFEIKLAELKQKNVTGAYVQLVWGDEEFLKYLATGNDYQVILQCGGTTVHARFSEEDIESVRQYAAEMLKNDFIKSVDTGDETDNLAFMLRDSSITSHIFEEIDDSVVLGDKHQAEELAQNDWKEYTANSIGVSMRFPADYDVYTREMSDDDPALVMIGMSGIEIANILASNDIYIDAFDPEENEIILTKKVGAYSDFSTMTDDGLRSVASLYPALSSDDGIRVSSTDIWRNNDLAFIIYEGQSRDSDGTSVSFIQYNTAVNGQTFSFVRTSRNGTIDDKDRTLMASLMKEVSISKTRVSQESTPDSVTDESETQEINPDEFGYETLKDGSVSINEYKGKSPDVVIPSTLDGHLVKTIDTGFSGNNSIRSIVIQDGVQNLGLYVFSDCSNMKKAVIPDSVITMGSSVFSKCEGLEKVKLSEGLTEIPSTLFYGCSSLSEVSLPERIISIGNGAFERCYSLRGIIIPESVKLIDMNAFRYCTSLTSIVIPEGVEKIGNHAFKRCAELTNIVIPASVESIGSGAFDECPKLTVTVVKGSAAEQYCIDNGVQYAY